MAEKKYIMRAAALAAAAAVCVMMTGCMSGGITAPVSTSNPQTKTSYTSDEVFEKLSAALSEYNNDTEFDAVLSQEAVDGAVDKVCHFYPDYFWLNGYTVTTNKDSTSVSFMTLNDYSADELRTMHEELIRAADKITAQVPAGSDDYSKALFVHDYIVNNTRYASEKLGLSYNGLWGTAYGCLVDGSAVCQGYAEAFSLIMQKLGIECGVCAGQSDRGSHAWNYIKTDGKYYWVDLTWDDPEAESSGDFGKLRHNYFMMDDELLLRTRTLNERQYYVPVCDSLDRNYFVMNNAYLNGYFPTEVGRVLAENADEGVAEIMFADETSFRSAVDGLFGNDEIWELSGYTELGYSLNYSCDETMYVLHITY